MNPIKSKRKNKNTLTEEQFNKLDSLPEWVWDVDEYRWTKGYSYLIRYVEENGDALVPSKYIFDDGTEHGYKLGIWRTNQRRRRNSSLTSEKIIKLESLNGWIW